MVPRLTGRNTYVVSGGAALANGATYKMIPGVMLLDKHHNVVSDATGHQPQHHLYKHLLPQAKRLLAPLNSQSGSATDSRKSATLKPHKDPKGFQSELAAPVQFSNYKISPPKGYQRRDADSPTHLQVGGWNGKKRADGTRPMIQLSILTPPPGEGLPDLETYMSTVLSAVKTRRTDWRESKTSYRLISGIRFAKKKWVAKEPGSGRAMAGALYAGFDGDSVITLYTQDLQSNSRSLKLGEASLLSFTK